MYNSNGREGSFSSSCSPHQIGNGLKSDAHEIDNYAYASRKTTYLNE